MNLSIFSERLADLMFEANLNGHTLPPLLGCGENTVYRYLQATSEPTLDMVILIADFFKCSTDFLLGLEAENYSSIYEKCPPFKDRFPALLVECGISQYRLEKITKIAHSAMVYWKNGVYLPTVDSIICIAEKLGKTVDFVLGRTKV